MQSTPLEEEQRKAGGGGFLKARLTANQALKTAGGAGFGLNSTAKTGIVLPYPFSQNI